MCPMVVLFFWWDQSSLKTNKQKNNRKTCQRAVLVIVVYETKAQTYGKKIARIQGVVTREEEQHVHYCTQGGLWGYQLSTIHVCSPAVLQDVSQDLVFPCGLTWAHCSGPGPGFGTVQHADSAHTEQTSSAAVTTCQGRNRRATQQIIKSTRAITLSSTSSS